MVKKLKKKIKKTFKKKHWKGAKIFLLKKKREKNGSGQI